MEIKNIGTWTGGSEAYLTNRRQEIEDRISGTGDMTEEMDTSVKENVNCYLFFETVFLCIGNDYYPVNSGL